MVFQLRIRIFKALGWFCVTAGFVTFLNKLSDAALVVDTYSIVNHRDLCKNDSILEALRGI